MHFPVLVPTAEIRERVGREVPADLWLCGRLDALALPTVAIVGTRAATPYGRGIARRFATELAGAGCCVISGLALGIDTEAHRGALEAGAPTIGVLGGGHERFFPKANARLASQMIDGGGAVLSPFPPDEAPRRPYFLARNGIVAALSDAVVVVEAPARSGALNTAQWAAGTIPVFAVPGDIDRPHSAGCHALLRDGAILAQRSEDILETLNLERPKKPARRDRQRLPDDPAMRRIHGELAGGERSVDELIAALGLPPPAVLTALSKLEDAGLCERRDGRFARSRGLLC